MAVLKGDVILLSANGNALKGTTDDSVEFTADMIDITTKDSNGEKEYLSGERDATISVEGKYDPTDTNEGILDVWDDYKSGTAITILFGQLSNGGTQWTCSGLVSSISFSGPKNDAATFSATLQVTGGATKQVVT